MKNKNDLMYGYIDNIIKMPDLYYIGKMCKNRHGKDGKSVLYVKSNNCIICARKYSIARNIKAHNSPEAIKHKKSMAFLFNRGSKYVKRIGAIMNEIDTYIDLYDGIEDVPCTIMFNYDEGDPEGYLPSVELVSVVINKGNGVVDIIDNLPDNDKDLLSSECFKYIQERNKDKFMYRYYYD